MAHIKNYNPGQLRLDLPSANYIYELPLFSIGDTRGSLGISLVYNDKLYSPNYDEFHISSGFKLNLEKKIAFNLGEPCYYIDGDGNSIDLVKRECPTASDPNKVLYTFADESERILRSQSNKYYVDYPDGSREEFDQNGYITNYYDKYSAHFLEYTYDLSRVKSIKFFAEKVINITYDTNNNISSITYAGSTTSFGYTSTGINVINNAGDVTALSRSGYNFSAQAGDSATSFKNAVRLTRNTAEKTIKIADIVYENNAETEINHITYKFPDTISYDNLYNQIETTDYYGVRHRIQYNDKTPVYSYEIGSSDVEFKDYGTVQRYAGNVQIMQKETTTRDVHVAGVQSVRSGLNMTPSISGDGTWSYELVGLSGVENGYYLLSGWARVSSNATSPENSEIEVYNNNAMLDHTFSLDLTPCNVWKYFSFTIKVDQITTIVKPVGFVELKDVRLSYQKELSEDEENETKKFAIEEDGVICHGSDSFIPLSECEIKKYVKVIINGGEVMLEEIDTASKIFFDDLLKHKILFKKNGSKDEKPDEFIFDHGRNVASIQSIAYIKIIHNGVSHSLNTVYLAKRKYVGEYGYVITKIVDNLDNEFLVYETLDKYNSVISKQSFNDKLDVISSTSNNVTTLYTRDAYGRILSESVKNSSNVVLYTRTTAYSTDDNENPTVIRTDEYNKTVVQTLDPVWGVVTKTTLPDGSVLTNEYDDDRCALTSISVGGSTVRTNTFGYTGGNLSSLQTGTLTYGFTYKGGELATVTKNSTGLEEHEYTTSSVSSYYPTKASKSYDRVTNFDKYGRVTSVTGEITNEYDVIADFDSSGVRTEFADNENSLLVSSTDEVTSETTRYMYNYGNSLSEIRVTSENSYETNIRQELFNYDIKNRLTDHTCVFEYPSERSVKGMITYRKNESDVTADNSVLLYIYKLGNNVVANTTNSYDTFNRINKKSHWIGSMNYQRDLSFTNTRLTAVVDKKSNSQTISNTTYAYDSLGRISSFTYNPGTAKTVSYSYDNYGQLIRENNQIYGGTYEYVYNNLGNITNVKRYSYTAEGSTPTNLISNKTFTYSSTHKDRLIAYNGNSISYNSYGYVSSYDGFSYSWTKGRLSGISKGSPRVLTEDYEATLFTYDGHGRRKSKIYIFNSPTIIVGSPHPTYNTTYKYDSTGRLIHEYCTETYKDSDIVHTHELVYLYDESSMVGVMYSYDGEELKPYYYHRNIFGDVIGIYDKIGLKAAEYAYDAFGNCQMLDYTNPNLAAYNPIRYRGYYYDRETQLYYLNARYYNPEWRRFISHDDSSYLDPESINGLNLYAYCGNDPINNVDPSGHLAISIGLLLSIGGIVGAVIGAGASVAGQYLANGCSWKNFSWGQLAIDTVLGGVGGMLSMSTLGWGAMIAANAGIGFVGAVGGHLINGSDFSKGSTWLDIGLSTILGALVGLIGGTGALNAGYLNGATKTAGFLRAAGLYDDVLTKAVTGYYRTPGIASNALRLSSQNLVKQWNKMVVAQAGKALTKALAYGGTALLFGTAGKGLLYDWYNDYF